MLAWKVTERFSIAAGLTINHASASLVQGVFSRGDQFRFDGSDTTFGFNAGLMWQPHPMHSFGVTYVSETTMDFSGETHTHFDDQHRIVPVAPGVFAPITIPGVDSVRDASASLRFPQHVTGGYSFRPTTELELRGRPRLDGLGHAEQRDAQAARSAQTRPSPSTGAPASSTSSASPATSASGTRAPATSTARIGAERAVQPDRPRQIITSFRSASGGNMIM